MKMRIGFISNSSSCSFTICNKTDEIKTLVDFIKENPQLLVDFNEEYKHNFTMEELLDSAKHRGIIFQPTSSQTCIFGDEDGTVVGAIFDYILRDGGDSDSFSWKLQEYLR